MEWNWSKTRPGFGLRVNGGILSKGGVKPGLDPDGNGMEAAQRDNATEWGEGVKYGLDLQWEWSGGGMDSEWSGLRGR